MRIARTVFSKPARASLLFYVGVIEQQHIDGAGYIYNAGCRFLRNSLNIARGCHPIRILRRSQSVIGKISEGKSAALGRFIRGNTVACPTFYRGTSAIGHHIISDEKYYELK